ncbi:uncharacterized protein LOC126292306 [Schistocerca gregaria]|uniref:uncharacterized protein LOC126292306 n=1 Tax=Schistocerca gregaria TaxID=7010 RepID=UPI00211E305F|nr:uncharacterized protein LOC126292306 [Schistocerca gregaria]
MDTTNERTVVCCRSQELQLVVSNSAGELCGLQKKLLSSYQEPQKYRQEGKGDHKFYIKKQKFTSVDSQNEGGNSGPSEDEEEQGSILEGGETAVDSNTHKSEATDREPGYLNFGFQKFCEDEEQSRYLLNAEKIDWSEELKFLDEVDKSKLEEPATSSKIEELLMCPPEKVERLSYKTRKVKGSAVPHILTNERMYCTNSAALIQEQVKWVKTEISHEKDLLLQCDIKGAVSCSEDSDPCDEAHGMKIGLKMNSEVFIAKDKVSDLQQSSFGIKKLTLYEATQSGKLSELNKQNEGGKRVKTWDHEVSGNNSGPVVKCVCLTNISGCASTYTSHISHPKMGFRWVDEKCPENNCLSLFKELQTTVRMHLVYQQNILQQLVWPVCGTSMMCVPFSLLGKPVGTAGIHTDCKMWMWGGSSAAKLSVNVAEYLLQWSLKTSQTLNDLSVTLCTYLTKSQTDLLHETLISLPKRKELLSTEQNNGTSSQIIAVDGNTIRVQGNDVPDVQNEEKEQKPVDCGFLLFSPVWSNLCDVQNETAECQVWNWDNGVTQRKSYSDEHITGDSIFLPSSRVVASELQPFSDRSSVMLPGHNEEFSVATGEMWAVPALEDTFTSEQEFLPPHRSELQMYKCHANDKIQSSVDETFLKLHDRCNPNGVLSPDYGFCEGDDAAGLPTQTASLTDKFCNVLDEHCGILTHADFPKTAKGNHERYENIFQKEAECKEKQAIERLCELLDVHIPDSNRKDRDKCSDTLLPADTTLTNITDTDQPINRRVEHTKFQQKYRNKVVLAADSQFQPISPEHVSLEDTGCIRMAPQKDAEAKNTEVLEFSHSVIDGTLPPSSDEEEEEDDDDDDDDDDSSSESLSSVVTVVPNASWVPQNIHQYPVGNQSQQRGSSGGVGEGESVPFNQLNDHTYAIVECPQTDEPVSCVARTSCQMTVSVRNFDNNESIETVLHTLGSDQSYSGSQSNSESADGSGLSVNEPSLQFLDDLVSMSVIGSSNNLEHKIVKGSGALLVDTNSFSNTTAETHPQCSEAVHLDCKHNTNLNSVQELTVISKLHGPSCYDTKAKGNNLSLSSLMVVPRSKRKKCFRKNDTVAEKILCRTKKKMLDIHRTSVGETCLQMKPSEELSRLSSAENKPIQSNLTALRFDNLDPVSQYTSKRRRKRVSEPVEAWLRNTITYFSGIKDEHFAGEMSKDVTCNLPKKEHDAPRVSPVSILPRKRSLLDSRSDESSGTELSTRPSKRRRGTLCDEGGVTVQTYSKGGCSVSKMSKGGNGAELSCTYCGKKFDRVSKLTEHIGSHTLPYHCLMCGRRFGRESQLTTHEQHLSCSPLEKCRYKCEGCGQKFLQRICLLRHVEKHTEQDKKERVEKSRCKVCGKVFDQAKLLLQHEGEHRTKGRQHTCRVCGKTFKRQAFLARHQQLHREKVHLECGYCGDCFELKDRLRTHIRQHLRDETKKALEQKRKVQQKENMMGEEVAGSFPIIERELSLLICSDCGKIFRWKTALQRHLAQHKREDRRKAALDAGLARFHCDNCGDNFASRGSLRSHVRRHVCQKINLSSVEVQRSRHHSGCTGSKECTSPLTTPILQYNCSKCLADFSQLSELQQHSCGTDDRRPYTCYICDKAFLSPRHLSQHMRVHFPPHKCRFCGDTFARRYELLYHEWSHRDHEHFSTKDKNEGSPNSL